MSQTGNCKFCMILHCSGVKPQLIEKKVARIVGKESLGRKRKVLIQLCCMFRFKQVNSPINVQVL